MIRLLDRYVVKKFLAPFVYCLAAFDLLFIIGDLFEHLYIFLRIPNWPSVMLKYYLLFLPSTFTYITAISILLSLLHSLGAMRKHNEISAMRSSGVSIYRITFPLLIICLGCSFAVFYINENVVPQTSKQSERIREEQAGSGNPFQDVLQDVTYYNPLTNRSFYFESFDPGNNTATGATVYELRPDGQPIKRISAREAAWLDNKWWFFKGFVFTFAPDKKPLKRTLTKEVFDFEVQPEDLKQSKKEFSYLSYRELKELLQRKKGFPLAGLRPGLVELHQKIALPLACLIMGLLGISFGLRGGRGGMLAGVGISLALGFLYYIIYSMAGALGKQGYLPPWLAAWLGNIIYGAAGLVMLIRLD